MTRTVTINWERAALAARAAGLAYADGEALVAGAGRLGLQVAQVLNDAATGANACLLKGDGLAILAVRGTERDFRDILADLDIRKSRLAGGDFAGRVHSGFLRQARAILDGKMAAAVRGLRDRGVTVIACGHSLGGAVALLAAVRLSLPEVYSFGAPRTGDSTFVQGLAAWRGTFDGARQVHHRFTRAADIVPHLPLLGLGFRHDAAALYFDGAGRFRGRAPIWRQWASLVWRSATGPWMRGPITGVPIPARPFTDHRVAGYENLMIGEHLFPEASAR
ncbi:MAG TPA: hypothetical protein DIW51_08915 [Rhodospirillaceae bacterium]|nr:hypothetical protein [Magnetovibrio sp.]HCS70075.1 hypothetical protein [Rhodospirillaceae bacterium]